MAIDLPDNCKVDGVAKKYQDVIRQSPRVSGLPVWRVLYHYDEKVLNDLNQQDPIQLSYLLLHEFFVELYKKCGF